MSVIAKFKVSKVERFTTRRVKREYRDLPREEMAKISQEDLYETVEQQNIKLNPVGNDSPENKVFWDYTPSGEISMGTVNPEAWKQFELDQEYYVEFKKA